jgi:hypothetical protein
MLCMACAETVATRYTECGGGIDLVAAGGRLSSLFFGLILLAQSLVLGSFTHEG